MSIRTTNIRSELDPTLASMEASSEELSLSEGNSFCVASPENPLNRNLVVSIKASLNSLCLQRSKGIWAPSTESLKATFQQRKFTSLDGEADSQGDLKSVVLHDLHATQVVSTFPISLGAKITGVDDITFTSTGQPFSMVVPPNSNAAIQSKLQSDDVSLGVLCTLRATFRASHGLSRVFAAQLMTLQRRHLPFPPSHRLNSSSL